jgi:S-layer homology domain
LPVRARALALVLAAAASVGAAPSLSPEPAVAGGPKVAVIVGPVGSMTNGYRTSADRVADAATAAGATVAKAYSPNATWSNVRAAVNGASVVVYFGHGNGYPNPYGSTELTDRANGWGLNRTTSNGDGDNWSSTMAYCGEKALLGTLTASDGAVQRQYCAGGPITPAPGFTMVYAQAHYAPGFGERYSEDDPRTTLSQARARVANYSTPILRLGGGAFFATAYGDAHEIVTRILTQAGATYGELFRAGDGYAASELDVTPHAGVGGAEVWVQETTISHLHFGQSDYWYAFAGDPNVTADGVVCEAAFSDICGDTFQEHITWAVDNGITTGCGGSRFCPSGTVTRGQMASFLARALALPAATRDHFADDNGKTHESDINKVAEAGITGGCADGSFCPAAPVLREQMASFVSRALAFATTDADYFDDDARSSHEQDINRFAEAGVTTGCGAARYCPRGTVTRAQMTAFLHRAVE